LIFANHPSPLFSYQPSALSGQPKSRIGLSFGCKLTAECYLKIQTFLPRGLGQGFNSTMVQKPIAIEDYLLYLFRQRLFGNQSAYPFGRS
jgi:hypothetical protein